MNPRERQGSATPRLRWQHHQGGAPRALEGNYEMKVCRASPVLRDLDKKLNKHEKERKILEAWPLTSIMGKAFLYKLTHQSTKRSDN